MGVSLVQGYCLELYSCQKYSNGHYPSRNFQPLVFSVSKHSKVSKNNQNIEFILCPKSLRHIKKQSKYSIYTLIFFGINKLYAYYKSKECEHYGGVIILFTCGMFSQTNSNWYLTYSIDIFWVLHIFV